MDTRDITTEELREAMETSAEDVTTTTATYNPHKKKKWKNYKKNRNIINFNDILAIHIFFDPENDGKAMADLRLSDGRIKRITWNDNNGEALKHVLMGGTIIYDDRPVINWADWLK